MSVRDMRNASGTVGVVFVLVLVSLVSTSVEAVNEDFNRVARWGTPLIDGDLSDRDWQGADWQEMETFAGGNQPRGFAAKSAVLWDGDFLYIAIEVDDDKHEVPKAVVPDSGNLWKGDSPQHRVDLEYDSLTNSPQDIEWGYALQDGKILTHAWASPNNIEFSAVEIVRDDASKKTYYESAVVLQMHKPEQTLTEFVRENPDTQIGYSDMVNANDGGDRLGWLEWSSGIGASKDANQFGTLTFDATPQAIAPTGKLAAVWAGVKRGL